MPWLAVRPLASSASKLYLTPHFVSMTNELSHRSAHYATYLCEKHSNPVRMGFRDKEMARSWLKAYFEGKDV